MRQKQLDRDYINYLSVIDCCDSIIEMINTKYSYYPVDLFKLATLVTQGMHRPSVWSLQELEGTKACLSIEVIDEETISRQADSVLFVLQEVHTRLCHNIQLGPMSKKANDKVIDGVLKDLLHKIAAVLIKQSLRSTNPNDDVVRHQLKRMGLSDTSDQIATILSNVHAIELDDQRKILPVVVSRYLSFLTLKDTNSARVNFLKHQCDLLLRHSGITCYELIAFDLKGKKHSRNSPKPDLSGKFYDYMRLPSPFDNASFPVIVSKQSNEVAFDPCIKRPEIPNTNGSPKSVASLHSYDATNYYSLFGPKTDFDIAMSALRHYVNDRDALCLS
ncbi:MAG: hypothetical protein CL816_03505 [Coxiellaceae bacterium]|nr:hypothetical protein [Coxiellaceae bacterium]|tara:strand:+ start:8656 stop:9651 length:996 start_codon:yes stop_codon:yes gene_type:complete